MVDTAEKAVYITELTKKIKSGDYVLEVLRGVDMEANYGNIVMIMGPSGSGKTTLLSIIAGTLSFDNGNVTVLGKSLNEMEPNELVKFRRQNVGFVFQQFHLINTLTCIQNVEIPLLLNDVDHKVAKKQAYKILEEVGLKEKTEFNPFQLSGGEQQRVAIARALIHDPRLLVCDEPTASLDAESGKSVMLILKKLALSKERCVLVVTHDNRILNYADKIIKMENGVIID